jgi:hypothetical protein
VGINRDQRLSLAVCKRSDEPITETPCRCDEGVSDDVYGPNPPLPPLDSGLSTSSYKLISGGSFSSPAAHYCPVCGIIATSQANLEVCTPNLFIVSVEI